MGNTNTSFGVLLSDQNKTVEPQKTGGFSFADIWSGLPDLVNSGANLAGSIKGTPQTVVYQGGSDEKKNNALSWGIGIGAVVLVIILVAVMRNK